MNIQAKGSVCWIQFPGHVPNHWIRKVWRATGINKRNSDSAVSAVCVIEFSFSSDRQTHTYTRHVISPFNIGSCHRESLRVFVSNNKLETASTTFR
jgi:hypothetical protein